MDSWHKSNVFLEKAPSVVLGYSLKEITNQCVDGVVIRRIKKTNKWQHEAASAKELLFSQGSRNHPVRLRGHHGGTVDTWEGTKEKPQQKNRQGSLKYSSAGAGWHVWGHFTTISKTHMMNSTKSDTAGIRCLGRRVDITGIRRVTNNKWSRFCKKSAVLQSGARIKNSAAEQKADCCLKKKSRETHREDFCYTPSNVGRGLLLINFLGEYLTV